MLSKKNVTVFLAEFFGVFVLGSVMLAVLERSTFPYFYSSATSLALAALVLIFGPISGAHLNPAITFGLLSLRRITVPRAAVYIIAQVAGGFVALRVSSYLLDKTFESLDKGWEWRTATAEIIGTLVLTVGVSAALSRVYDYERPVRALIIGASLLMGMLAASFAGIGILNPSLAVATNNASLSYLIAPLIGGVMGMNVYKYVLSAPDSKNRK